MGASSGGGFVAAVGNPIFCGRFRRRVRACRRNWLGRRTIGSLTANTMDKHCALFGLAVGVALLAAGSAHADHALECDKVQLPSSLVICSDPDLLAIADERGQVYQELWARLDTAQRAALKAYQDQ